MAELASRTATGGAVGDTFEGYEIIAIQADGTYVWKKQPDIDGVSSFNGIGTFKAVPNIKEDGTAKVNDDYVAEGLLPLVTGFRFTDGALSNPKFALMFPTFVSGDDLLVPSMNGRFLRNLGGNASAFMVQQADQIASHRHLEGESTFSSAGAGNGFATGSNNFASNNNSRTTAKAYTYYTGGNETRPDNFAMQFCLTLDRNEIRITNLGTATPGQIPVLQADGTFRMEDK